MLGCLLWPFRLAGDLFAWAYGVMFPRRRSTLLDVVGESHYQDNLRRICGRPTASGEDRWKSAMLVPEPDNPQDGRAVRVEISGRTVGYLPRETAGRLFATLPAAGQPVRAHITGGGKRKGSQGHYGVKGEM